MCRASTDCNGGPGDDLGLMTREQCCFNTPNGLGFSNAEFCSPCTGEYITLCHNIMFIKDLVDFGYHPGSGWSYCVLGGGTDVIVCILMLLRLCCVSGSVWTSGRLPLVSQIFIENGCP